jgi:uncharacterized Rmd1/YagE family protein
MIKGIPPKIFFIMRCSAYCIAENIDLISLKNEIAHQYVSIKLLGEALHIVLKEEDEYIHDIIIFNYGCVIFWGIAEEDEQTFLDILTPYLKDPVPKAVMELYNVMVGEETRVHEEDSTVELGSYDPLIRLSFSHGFAQSVKLDLFEKSIDISLKNTRPLLDELARTGKSALSKKQLSKKIGDLFSKRNAINLHCDILDTPEFFWRRPKYEPYYLMSAQYMDIGTRMDILNKRLDVIHELYNILSDELKHAHSSFLEMVIILLIVSEVTLAILKDVLKIL